MKTHRGFLMVWALAGITVIPDPCRQRRADAFAGDAPGGQDGDRDR